MNGVAVNTPRWCVNARACVSVCVCVCGRYRASSCLQLSLKLSVCCYTSSSRCKQQALVGTVGSVLVCPIGPAKELQERKHLPETINSKDSFTLFNAS